MSHHHPASSAGHPGPPLNQQDTTPEALGLKRRHWLVTALTLDAATWLAACDGGGVGWGDGDGVGSGSGYDRAAPPNMVTTWAGSGASTPFTDGAFAGATFKNPYGLAVDSTGTVYVADTSNNRIRKISPAGVVSTLAGTGASGSVDGTAGTARLNYPTGVAVDRSGTVYVADLSNHLIRVISPAGVVST